MLMTQQRMSTGISITIFDHLALALDLFAALAAALVRPERCRQHVNAGKIQHLYQPTVMLTHRASQNLSGSIRCGDSDCGGMEWGLPLRLLVRSTRAQSCAR